MDDNDEDWRNYTVSEKNVQNYFCQISTNCENFGGSTMTATNNDHDGLDWAGFNISMTMMATNHDDQLGEIYLTMLNEINCTYGISFSRFIAVTVMVMVCGIVVCGRHGCGHNGLWPSWYRPKFLA